MRKETAQEKENRIFEFYRKDLGRLGKSNGQIRMNVIEYVCSFPKINPYKMAAVLSRDGFDIAFDDSSIGQKENERKRKAVEKLTI